MGVFCKKRADGTPVWFADFFDQRKQRVREAAGFAREDAVRLEKIRRGEVAAGTYVNPRDPKPEAAEIPTLAKFVEQFQRDYPGRRHRPRSKYYGFCIAALVRYFGTRRLDEVTVADVDLYIATRRNGTAERQPVADGTIRKEVTVLKTIFRTAVRWRIIAANPVAEASKPAQPDTEVDPLTVEQYRAALAEMPDWLRPRAELAVGTGFRLKEVLTLAWDDVRGDLIRLERNNKPGRFRYVPVSATARAALDARQTTQEAAWREACRAAGSVVTKPRYVFEEVGQGCPYPAEQNRTVKATCAAFERVGLTGGFHRLRHTFATLALAGGATLDELEDILGHATPAQTRKYAKFLPEFGKRAASAVDRAFGVATDTKTDTNAAEGPGADPAGSAQAK